MEREHNNGNLERESIEIERERIGKGEQTDEKIKTKSH